MATGQNFKASDFNIIRDRVEQVLGSGGELEGDYGYNQALLSWPAVISDEDLSNEDPPNSNIATLAQWNALKHDILNIRLHQTGTITNIAEPSATDPIRYGSSYPNTNFKSLADQSAVTRLNVGPGRTLVTLSATSERTEPWSTVVSSIATVEFGGFFRADGVEVSPVNHARAFFNSGGRIRILSSRTGGLPSLQNNSWTSLLVRAAAREISAHEPAGVGFYQLTDEYKTLFELSASGPYSANIYRIQVKCDVPDNQTATATKLFFRISFEDNYSYISQADVTGILKIDVEELKASGPIFRKGDTTTPTGAWLLPSPTYSITDITGS